MEFVFQAVDVGGEFRDIVEDGGGPGGFHALADGGLHAGEFIGRDGGVFFLGQPHLVAAGDDAHAVDSGVQPLADVGDGVAHLDNFPNGSDAEPPHVLEYHVGGGSSGSGVVGGDQIVHDVTFGCRGRADDVHHAGRVARGGADEDALVPQGVEGVDDPGYGGSEFGQGGEEVPLEMAVEFIYVVLGPGASVAGEEGSGDFRHGEDGPDVVYFQHTHRFAGLPRGDGESLFLGEYLEKGVERGEAAVVNGGACPVHDDTFDSVHIFEVYVVLHVGISPGLAKTDAYPVGVLFYGVAEGFLGVVEVEPVMHEGGYGVVPVMGGHEGDGFAEVLAVVVVESPDGE